MSAKIKSIIDFTLSVCQAVAHVLLRDFTNYYWYKEIAQCEQEYLTVSRGNYKAPTQDLNGELKSFETETEQIIHTLNILPDILDNKVCCEISDVNIYEFSNDGYCDNIDQIEIQKDSCSGILENNSSEIFNILNEKESLQQIAILESTEEAPHNQSISHKMETTSKWINGMDQSLNLYAPIIDNKEDKIDNIDNENNFESCYNMDRKHQSAQYKLEEINYNTPHEPSECHPCIFGNSQILELLSEENLSVTDKEEMSNPEKNTFGIMELFGSNIFEVKNIAVLEEIDSVRSKKKDCNEGIKKVESMQLEQNNINEDDLKSLEENNCNGITDKELAEFIPNIKSQIKQENALRMTDSIDESNNIVCFGKVSEPRRLMDSFNDIEINFYDDEWVNTFLSEVNEGCVAVNAEEEIAFNLTRAQEIDNVRDLVENEENIDFEVESDKTYKIKSEEDCKCCFIPGCLQVIDEDDFLSDIQLQSIETASVSDWLFRVNPAVCLQTTNDVTQATQAEGQERLNKEHESNESIEAPIDEIIIKNLFVQNWLNMSHCNLNFSKNNVFGDKEMK